MGLSSDLISQIVKVSKDEAKKSNESTVYGTTVEYNGSIYVRLDGSDLLTPINTTADTKPGERVTVMIKDHTATVTGNISSPAARTEDVKDIGNKISEFEIVIADKVSTKELEAESARINELVADNVTIKEKLTASEAEIDDLQADNVTVKEKLTANEADISNLKTTKLDAEVADIKYATVENLNATNADIHNLEATYGEFKNLTTDKLDAAEADIDKLLADKLDAVTAKLTYATVENLNATNAEITLLRTEYGDFAVLTAEQLNAISADVKDLQTNKLSASDADIKYANIDFSNIGKAAMEYLYSASGLIKDIVIGDGTITGDLVGVTISGDLIKGNTIVAEKLVIKGSDGLYYKLNTDGVTTETEQTDQNSLNGSIIKAKSITASKISVKDLVAFGATIGGFHITDNAIYSGVKETVDNTTRGTYMDSDGQVAFGDASNYLKFYKDANGKYRLVISADNVLIGSSGKNVETVLDDVQSTANQARDDIANLEIGGRNLILNSNIEISNNDYMIRSYTPSSPLVAGEIYTCSVCITPGAGLKHITPYSSGGYIPLTDMYVNGTEKQIISSRFTAKYADGRTPDNSISYANINVYRFPNDGTVTSNTAIHWIKIEKGNKATDWTPAPEDLSNKTDLDAAVVRIEEAEASIEKNQSDIILRATKNEVVEQISNIKIGGTNLLLDSEKVRTTHRFLEIRVNDILADHIGKQITVSFDAKVNDGGIPRAIGVYGYQGNGISIDGYFNFTLTTEWQRFSFVTTVKDYGILNASYTPGGIAFYDGTGENNYSIRKVKIELGNKATEWSPAPADMAKDSDLDALTIRVSEAEADIKVAGEQIELRAKKTEVEAVATDLKNLEIGGRNLIRFSDLSTHACSIAGKSTNDILVQNVVGSNSSMICINRTFSAGTYTVNATGSVSGKSFRLLSSKNFDGSFTYNQYYEEYGDRAYFKDVILPLTMIFTDDVLLGFVMTSSVGNQTIIDLKLEKGNKATDWTPAPEDLESRVTETETKIIQNASSITQLATRTDAVETRFGNYSTTTEMNAAIETKANGIASTVRSELVLVEQKADAAQADIDNLTIGGRNLLLSSKGDFVATSTGSYGCWNMAIDTYKHGIKLSPNTSYAVSFDYSIDWGDCTPTHPAIGIGLGNGSGTYLADIIHSASYSATDYGTVLTKTEDGYPLSGKIHATFIVNDASLLDTYPYFAMRPVRCSAADGLVGATFTLSNLKLEEGNKVTDWTPAPEDVDSDISDVKDIADAAQKSSGENAKHILEAQSIIQQLKDAISLLVTDSNGTTLLEQTSTGWSFNLQSVQDNVESATERLGALTDDLGNTQETINTLQSAVDDLGIISEYIKIGTYTYTDEDGTEQTEPSIDLGEHDTGFKLKITNTRIWFTDGSNDLVSIDSKDKSLVINKAKIKRELEIGDEESGNVTGVWIWKQRSNGNLGLTWKEVSG